MAPRAPNTATAAEEVFENYMTTTAGRAVVHDRNWYETSATGLRRRLGEWAPRPGDAVLDLGCGVGSLLYLARATNCSSVTGVDLCSGELEVAAKFSGATVHKADVLSFLRQDRASYDWIGCLNILEHMTKDDVLETLRLSAARLKPGGALVAMVPNGLSPMSGSTRYWDFTHLLAFVPNNFRQLAPLCGFAAPEFRECGPVTHGLLSAIRSIAWQGLRLGIRAYRLIETGNASETVYTMDMLVRMPVGSLRDGGGTNGGGEPAS